MMSLLLWLCLFSCCSSVEGSENGSNSGGTTASLRPDATAKSDALSDVECTFLSVPSPESAQANLRYITSQPHVAGTEGDRLMADYVSSRFTEYGIPNVSTFELDALINYPAAPPRVTLLSSQSRRVIFEAAMSEDVLSFDSTSDTFWRNHTFHGYSPSGDVTAPVVYANYGRPTDFDALASSGISVAGKIVLVRYGECFRGLKVMNAQLRNASAVLIYSDPADDGYGIGKPYPDGAWRSESGVQRGSVQFNSLCAGDPMRADARYSKANVTLNDLCGVEDYADLIPSIPSVPISYGDALPVLRSLGGPRAVEVGGRDFVGGIANLTYTVGPSTSTVVNVVVNNTFHVRPLPNVVGVIPGSLPPDEDMPVLLGNHRDAWVYGAADPNSGTASLLEVAKGLGHLVLTKGWQPTRSIYLLSWSGEEYGLLGSTGWAELNSDLIKRASAYLNVDTAVSGDMLAVAATPALATVWEQVLHAVHETDHRVPFENGPRGLVVDANTNLILPHDGSSDPKVGTLGSGSDYTAFLDHFGIASLDFKFSKAEGTYGQYHSVYDSFSWMAAFGGRDGEVGSAFELMSYAAKLWGVLALRLAGGNGDGEVVPFDHIRQGQALGRYVDAIRDQGHSDVVENEEGGVAAGRLDLAELDKAVGTYQHAAAALHAACFTGSDDRSPEKEQMDRKECNEKLALTERHFLSEEGLPGRPWFKHVLQAPGLYLGYAAEAFPGVQQAIDDGDVVLAQNQVGVLVERVRAAAEFMEEGVDGITSSG